MMHTFLRVFKVSEVENLAYFTVGLYYWSSSQYLRMTSSLLCKNIRIFNNFLEQILSGNAQCYFELLWSTIFIFLRFTG